MNDPKPAAETVALTTADLPYCTDSCCLCSHYITDNINT